MKMLPSCCLTPIDTLITSSPKNTLICKIRYNAFSPICFAPNYVQKRNINKNNLKKKFIVLRTIFYILKILKLRTLLFIKHIYIYR